MKIAFSNIVTCFEYNTIGTRVVNPQKGSVSFWKTVVSQTEFDADGDDGQVKGQRFIPLGNEALDMVSCGVGRRSVNPDDYVARSHRGAVGLYLKRSCAVRAESVGAVVYTRDAYLADPDVANDTEEFNRISGSDCTHVLVTVIAAAGPKPPVGMERFVKNLAGGNNEYAVGNTTHEALISLAGEVVSYHDQWCTVAD